MKDRSLIEPNNQPSLSICIPFYSGLKNLARLFHSLKAQEVELCQDENHLEVVICNDNPDISYCDLSKLASGSGLSARIYQNQVTLGLAGNWNKALSLGRGKIVTLLHDDDYYSNSLALREIVAIFHNDPSIAIVISNALLDYGQDKEKRLQFPSRDAKIVNMNSYLQGMFDGYASAPSVTFFARDSLLSLGDGQTYYDSEFEWCPELDLYRRIAIANKNRNVYIDNRAHVTRGISKDQFSANTHHLQIKDYIKFWEKASNDNRIEASVRDALRDRFIHYLSKPLLALIKQVCDPKVNNGYTASTVNQYYLSVKYMHTMLEGDASLQNFLCVEIEKIESNDIEGILALIKAGGILEPLSDGIKVKLKRIFDRKTISYYHALNKDSLLDSLFYKPAGILKDSRFIKKPALLIGKNKESELSLTKILQHFGVFTIGNDSRASSTLVNHTADIARISELVSNCQQHAIGNTLYLHELLLRLVIDSYLGFSPLAIACNSSSCTLNYLENVFPNSKVISIVDSCNSGSDVSVEQLNSELMQISLTSLRKQPLSTVKILLKFIDESLSPSVIDFFDLKPFQLLSSPQSTLNVSKQSS